MGDSAVNATDSLDSSDDDSYNYGATEDSSDDSEDDDSNLDLYSVTQTTEDSVDEESTESYDDSADNVEDDENMFLDQINPDNASRGDLMVSLSPLTIANLWAVTGLLLLVNITFCLYRVCADQSKQRYYSESDHNESDVIDPDLEANSYWDEAFRPRTLY